MSYRKLVKSIIYLFYTARGKVRREDVTKLSPVIINSVHSIKELPIQAQVLKKKSGQHTCV